MAPKYSFSDEVATIQHQLQNASPDSTMPYDLRWAYRILCDEDIPPPEIVRAEVVSALAEELVVRKAAETLSRLAKLSHRVVAKAARTGLHRLRSQKIGIEIPATIVSGPSGTGLIAAAQGLQGLLSMYDSHGQRVVGLTQPATKGIIVHQACISAEFGLLEFESWTSSRRQYKQLIEKLRGHLAIEFVDLQLAHWFLEDGAKRCQEAKRALPKGYVRASQSLGPPPSGQHPALAIPPVSANHEDLLGLFQLRELARWLPDQEFMQRLILRLQEVATSRVVLDERQRADQLKTSIERAVPEYYTPSRCVTCRRILLDTAHLLAVGNRTSDASLARAAADLFALPLEQLIAHPFAQKFIDRILKPKESAPKEEDKKEIEETQLAGGLILPGRG